MLQFNATFLVAMFSFIVFIIIMDKILFKPVSKIVNEREEFINKNYDEARETNIKSETIHKNREEKLLQTKADARKIISDKVDAAHKESKEKTETAMQKSRNEINNAKENLHASAVETQEKLQDSISDLAESITEKILGEKFPIDNAEIINKV